MSVFFHAGAAVRWVLIAALTVFLLAAGTQAAFAHASLLSSEPADGVVLQEAPETLILRFSEPVRPLVARLILPGGHTAIMNDIGEKGDVIELTLPPDLQHGTHILSWRVASSDGHPIGGGLVFSIGAPSAISGQAVEQSDPVVQVGLWFSRYVLITGLVVGVGGVAFSRLISRAALGPAHGVIIGALLAGSAATPAFIGFQGLDALGEPLSGLARLDVWQAGLSATSYGRATVLAAVALLLAGVASRPAADRRSGQGLGIAALLVLGFAVSAAGHAASASPRIVTIPAVFLHAVSVTLWLGSLIPLLILLKRSGPEMRAALRRFSTVIPIVVAILVLSGIALSVVQLETMAALWSTDYGVILLVKLGLVVLMFALAAVNRHFLTEPAMAGGVTSIRHLRRSILVEIIAASLVIAAVGLWRFTPPPRVIAAQPPAAQEVRVDKDGVSARLSIQPPAVGPVTIAIGELLLDGKVFQPISVSIDLDKPSYGIGPFTRQAKRQTDGSYVANGFVLPLDGFWVVRVTVLVSDFRSVTLTDIFDVRK